MESKKFLIGILMCLTAVVSWGGMFPIMGSALKIIDPFYFTLFRYVSASIVLVLLLLLIEGLKGFSTEGNLSKIWFLGTMGFAGFSFFVFLGQRLAGSSGAVIAAVIMAVQPLLGVIVNFITTRAVPKLLTVLFMLTGLIGVVMVISKGDVSTFVEKDANISAYLFILLGALCFVIYTMGGSSFSNWSPLRYSTLTSLYGTISIIIIVSLGTLLGWLKAPSVSTVNDVSGALFYTAFIAGVLAFFVWNIGNRLITPINGILFMNMVPVTTFIISVIQGYHLSTFELAGALITVGSLIGNNLYTRKINKKEAVHLTESTAR
ncbi:DMT family transporter [Priestia megaterium]|uniref:DMT family transporter n=1 Tax=Priestia megaterium TaxID=1404 RepID=UPI000EFA21D6|nr:DMT family transporter [Priestia megaterium]RMA90205.1 EamA-like transporter family protein [Priestia megaterium]